MQVVGFWDQWIALVMSCVTTLNDLILVNEKLGPTFLPSRKLRQGDPLSPCLILFCMEGLSSMKIKVETRGKIQRVVAVRGGKKISHLFFADNNILFCSTTLEKWTRIKTILHKYERALGQMANEKKSYLFFSTNTSTPIKASAHQAIGGHISGNYDRYLGRPPLEGRSKYNKFCWIKEKLLQKFNSWKTKMLPQVRKEVLIKAVLQAIPVYIMSVYWLPHSLCHNLASMIARF